MTWTGALLGFLGVVIVARWLLVGGDRGTATHGGWGQYEL